MVNRKILNLVSLIVLSVLIMLMGNATLLAQGEVPGFTIDNLNVRTGPGAENAAITTIPARTNILIEGRNSIGNWVLIHTADNGVRGWVASRYVAWDEEILLANIPVVEEILGSPTSSDNTVADTVSAPAESSAPGVVNGVTVAVLNMRSGPGTESTVLATLPFNSRIAVEGRNQVGDWLLVHTVDNSARGWVASRYVNWDEGLALSDIPVTGEPANPAVVVASDEAAPVDSSTVSEAEARLISALSTIPVVPAIGGNVTAIYQRGQALGNNPYAFAKVGDCNTESIVFLGLFGRGQYSLGSYGHLQTTINHYSASFAVNSVAARNGYLANTIIDPLFGDLERCHVGESPLGCEYRRMNPSVSLIMLGMQETQLIDHETFRNGLEHIVVMSINQGIIPVLTTFPTRSHPNRSEQSALEFNMIIVNLARQYNVPLINLWRAARGLPQGGVEDDLIHITYNGNLFTDLSAAEQSGFDQWNLITLQTLDAIRRALG